MQITKTSLLLGALALSARAQDDSSCDPQNDNNNDATCTGFLVTTTASPVVTGINTVVNPTGGIPVATTTGSPEATGSCSSGYQCPIQPTSQDAATLNYAYAIQNLLVEWYGQWTSFSASDFSSIPMADTMQSNGETYATNSATNFAGLQTQARLGLEAIMQLGQIVPGFEMSTCNYNLPPGLNNITAAIMSATVLEATLCGAFIGGADYAYHPAVANLMARMSAEHGIHGSYLQGFTMPVQFNAESMSLTPAFNPEQIMSSGMGVGYLGDYIPQGCVAPPPAPCGGTISFGSLLPTTMGAIGMAASATTSASAFATGGSGTVYGASTTSNGVVYTSSYATGYGPGTVYGASTTSNGVLYTSSYAGIGGINGTGAAGASYTGPLASQSVAAYTGAAAAPTGFGGLAGAVGAGIAALAML